MRQNPAQALSLHPYNRINKKGKRVKNTLYLLLLVLVLPLEAATYSREIKKHLTRLDSLVVEKESLERIKELQIEELRQEKKYVSTVEEEYELNRKFYQEFFIYDADSAFYYIHRNMQIAKDMGWKDRVVEWKIKKSHVLAATGLLKEAVDAVQGITGSSLPQELRVEYYGQMMYLYSHFGQYIGEAAASRPEYDMLERLYADSVYAVVEKTHPDYLWYKGGKLRNASQTEEVIGELKQDVDNSHLDKNRDAMNAYILAQLYRNKGDEENYLKYIILSAQADVRISNRDIASLEELSKVLFEMGDIDRAYTYANYCFQIGQAFHNRIRVSGILTILDEIHKAYQERNRIQQARLSKSLLAVSILSLVLLVAIVYIYRQMKRLSVSRKKLDEANLLLNEHVEQLSEAHRKLKEANESLLSLNEALRDTNGRLRESNYIKEEYIGYVFSICSTYISKLDDFRKSINRKLKTGQLEEVKALTDQPVVKNELKEFYHNFDAIFLHVYPDFVNDFNTLLRPEERIVMKEGELLNTDLRIYALVRLGINDSVKIAEFLHCSPQTVYNNRLKMRNRAIIPKEDFAERVKSLGKMQQ